MLETDDLILRQGKASDWEDLYHNLWSRESVFQYLFSRPSQSPDAARKKTEAYSMMHQEVPTEFFVIEKASMQAIGIAGIKQLAPKIFTVTDIAIGPSFSGKGYGKQILLALTKLTFVEQDADELHYSCFSQNDISKKLALSCGFIYDHSQETELPKKGEIITLDHFIRRKINV